MRTRASRGLYRGVYSALFEDMDYQALSPHARLTLLTLRLCKEVGPGCIFRYYSQVVASQTGLAELEVEQALQELETRPSPSKAFIHRDGPVLWITRGLQFDPSLRLDNPKHLISLLRSVTALPNVPMVATFCQYYGITKAMRMAIGKPRGRLSKGYGIAFPFSESESESEKEKEKESELRARDAPTQAGPGSLTRPATDGSDGVGGALAESHRRCPICRHSWLGGPRCPKEASHAPRPARPVAG